MSDSSFFLAQRSEAEARLARVFEVTGCRTQTELAQFLGIKQSSISEAKRRKAIPSDWLIKLLRMKGVNPEWITHGTEPKFLMPSGEPADTNRPDESSSLVRTIDTETVRKILGCFPYNDLESELQRRRGQRD